MKFRPIHFTPEQRLFIETALWQLANEAVGDIEPVPRAAIMFICWSMLNQRYMARRCADL